MLEHAKEITIVLALLNLAVLGGYFLGKVRATADSAHHRINDLEDRICKSLENTLRESWRFCPLASKDGAHKEVS